MWNWNSFLIVLIYVTFLPEFFVILPSHSLPPDHPPNLTEEPLVVHEDGSNIIEGWCPHVSRNISHYVLPRNVTTILQPTWSCRKHLPYLLVIVCSALDHVEARAAIRDTWGSVRKVLNATVHVAFLIGTTSPNFQDDEHQILDEYYRFGDIIQEDFVDSYNNLTLKSVFLLKWVLTKCTGARFVLKSDDDMFVNIRSLVLLLRRIERKRALANYKESTTRPTAAKKIKTYPPLLLGKLFKDVAADDDSDSKYYAPWYMYSPRKYPNYLSGGGYVMSANAIAPLYNQALRTSLFHLEDVFITGICAAQAGIIPRDHTAFTNVKREIVPCHFKDKSVVTSHHMDARTLREIWTRMQRSHLNCSPKKRRVNKKKWKLTKKDKIKTVLENQADANLRTFSKSISNVKSRYFPSLCTLLPFLFNMSIMLLWIQRNGYFLYHSM